MAANMPANQPFSEGQRHGQVIVTVLDPVDEWIVAGE